MLPLKTTAFPLSVLDHDPQHVDSISKGQYNFFARSRHSQEQLTHNDLTDARATYPAMNYVGSKRKTRATRNRRVNKGVGRRKMEESMSRREGLRQGQRRWCT